MSTKYIVGLTETERASLLDLIKKGKPSVRKVTRAHILLRADEDASDEALRRIKLKRLYPDTDTTQTDDPDNLS